MTRRNRGRPLPPLPPSPPGFIWWGGGWRSIEDQETSSRLSIEWRKYNYKTDPDYYARARVLAAKRAKNNT